MIPADGYDAEDRFVRFDRPSLSDSSLYDDNEVDVQFLRGSGGPSIGNITSITGGEYQSDRSYISYNTTSNGVQSLHQLGDTGLSGSSNVQQYDGAGNVILTHAGVGLTWTVAAGRLDKATVAGNDQLYGYDATGRRAWKETNDGSNVVRTVYVYSGPNVIAEYVAGSTDSLPGNEYVYSDGIDSLTMVVHNNGSKLLGVVRNQQWSVIGLLDIETTGGNSALAEQYAYNVFGERLVFDEAGAYLEDGSQFGNDYGYTSRKHDHETKLMYFRARYYDPLTGRFISLDPLGQVDGPDLYRGYFALGEIDPLGQDVVDPRAVWFVMHYWFGGGAMVNITGTSFLMSFRVAAERRIENKLRKKIPLEPDCNRTRRTITGTIRRSIIIDKPAWGWPDSLTDVSKVLNEAEVTMKYECDVRTICECCNDMTLKPISADLSCSLQFSLFDRFANPMDWNIEKEGTGYERDVVAYNKCVEACPLIEQWTETGSFSIRDPKCVKKCRERYPESELPFASPYNIIGGWSENYKRFEPLPGCNGAKPEKPGPGGIF